MCFFKLYYFHVVRAANEIIYVLFHSLEEVYVQSNMTRDSKYHLQHYE